MCFHPFAGTTSKYFTPAGEPAAPSSATVFGTPAQTLEPVTHSSKTPASRGIPSSPPPPPPHLATPVSKQSATQPRGAAGIPSKRVDINVSTPPTAQPAPAGQSLLPRSPVNSTAGEAMSPQPLHQIASTSPGQPVNHIADVPATAAALQRLKHARTGNRPPAAVPVPSHLLASTSEHIPQDPASQPAGDTRSTLPASSPSPQKVSSQLKHGATAGAPQSPVSPGMHAASTLVSPEDTEGDAVHPASNTTSSEKAARQVPVHLKKKASGANSTGVKVLKH